MDASQMATIAMPRALPRNTHVNRQVAKQNEGEQLKNNIAMEKVDHVDGID